MGGLVVRHPVRSSSPVNRPLAALGLTSLLVLLAACSGAPAPPPEPPGSVDPGALRIASRNLRFSTDRLVAPADEPFQIVFENQEAAPHNVAVYTDRSAARVIFREEPFSGPRTVVYEVPALAPAAYFFRCDVHPEMQGTLEVQ